MTRSSRYAFLLSTGLALLSAPIRAALAQESAGPTAPSYDTLIAEAVAEFDAERWPEARLLFERAHAIEPSARTLRAIGMCAFEIRDYAAAVVAFEDAKVDARRPLSPRQLEEVERLLASARGFVIELPLEIEPPAATLTVDGAPAVMREGRILLNPGAHDVRAVAEGHAPYASRIVAQSGPTASLAIVLEPVADAATAVASAPEGEGEPSGERSRALRRVGWITLGAGAGVGVTALALGLRAHSIYEDLAPDCPCPDRAGEIDRGERMALASTALTFTAAGAAAAGITMLVLDATRGRDDDALVSAGPMLAPGLLGGEASVRF